MVVISLTTGSLGKESTRVGGGHRGQGDLHNKPYLFARPITELEQSNA